MGFLNDALPFVSIGSGKKLLADSPFVVHDHPCVLSHVMVYTDGANDAVLTVYDNASAASGKVMAQITVIGADRNGGVIGIHVRAENGITCSLTGTGSSAIVNYVDTSRPALTGGTLYG